MNSLLVFTLVCYGFSYIVGSAKISLPFRTWLATKSKWAIDFAECPACVGTWTGLFVAIAGFVPSELSNWWTSALYVCASNLILETLLTVSNKDSQ